MLLDVKNLETEFKVKRGTVKAVNGVSFQVDKGEILAVVGESGSGKSVTSLSIMGLIRDPGRVSGGEILFNGEDLLKKNHKEMEKIRGDRISMIFQEPMTSLNPVYRIKDQIMENILTHEKVSKEEAYKRAVKMLELVGIPDPRLSPSDVRRYAPARDDRHGLVLPSGASDRRRAHHSPGRDHPGSDPGPDQPPEK